MALSEDLVMVEAFLAVVAAGEHEFTPTGLGELRVMVARAAEDAARLEDEVERLTGRPAEPADALADGIRSGKVVRLAAVRLARMREVQTPGWLA